jgi:hypothetical protein
MSGNAMLWFLGICFGIAAVLVTVAIVVPAPGDDTPAPVRASSASSALCPHDTGAQLDTFARNASREIVSRGGKSIPPERIRAEVLDTVRSAWGTYPTSCVEVFLLYVIYETS